jgi:hypothetical protein
MNMHLAVMYAAVAVGSGMTHQSTFFDAYKTAAEQWEDLYAKNIEVKATGTTYDSNGKVDTIDELHLIANDRCRLARRVRVENGVEQAPLWYLLRPDGYFVIYPSQSGTGHFLRRAQLGEMACHDAPYPLSVLTLPFHRSGRYLPDHLASSAVSVIADTGSAGDPLRQVRVRERFVEGAAIQTLYRFRSEDQLTLDGFDVESSPEPESLHFRLDYTAYDLGTYPAKSESYRKTSAGKTIPSTRIEFTDVRRASFPDSEFSLERFGLPESVNFTPRRPAPVYLWILAAAGGCALFAILFRFLARRHARALKSNPGAA